MTKKSIKKKKKTNSKAKKIIACALIGVLILGGVFTYLGFFMPRGFLTMGMNVSGAGYYFDRGLMFNDVMKTKNVIGTAGFWQGGYSDLLADDGYPAGYTKLNDFWDANAPTILINNIYAGDYVFLYDGDGEIAFDGGVEVISYAPNKIYLRLKESETQRIVIIKSSSFTNHVRNFRMIPKEFDGKESKMPTFRKDYLDGLKGLKVLRFMDSTHTNGSTQVHWADRPKTTDFSYQTQGLPWEYLIELCNTLKIDGWFCVPHKASDDYIKNLARLIKSDLNKKLKAYVEYSNETWHEGFEQGRWISDDAPDAVDEYVKTDLASLVSPRYGTDNRHLKTAYFMARTFKIFSAEFTGKDRKRLVTVGTRYYWEYPREIIEYLIGQGVKPDVMADVAYFNFDEAHHNRWLANPAAVKPIDIINAVNETWDAYAQGIKDGVAIYKEFGIPYVVYEGGQHMQPFNQGDWPYNQAVYDAQIHPAMYDLYMKNYRLHADLGCQLFMNFSYVSARESRYGSWGVLENASDASLKNLKAAAPKYKAVRDANKRKGLFAK